MKQRASFKAFLNGVFVFVWIAASASLLVGESIPQKFLGDLTIPPSGSFRPIRYKGILIRYDNSDRYESTFVVSGKDKGGLFWTVNIGVPGGLAPGYGWATDLDADGVEELIFVLFDGGNGWCVGGADVTIISFDGEGRPVRWSVRSFLHMDYDWETEKGDGVLDFGDWNKNGRVEFMQFNCDFDSSQEIPRWFSIEVYERNGMFWRRLSKSERAKYALQYNNYARSAQEDFYPEEAGDFSPDYSNDPGPPTRIVSYIAAVAESERCGIMEGLAVEDGRIISLPEHERERNHERCNAHFVLEDGTSCYGTPHIIMSTPPQSDAAKEWSAELLHQIINEKLPVRISGKLEERYCSPATISVTSPPSKQ